MIVDQKLEKEQFFYLYISTTWILNRNPDNPVEGYLARLFEVQITCQLRKS